MDALERKYIHLCGKLAEARAMKDFVAMCGYKYDLECLKEEMGW